MRLIKGLTISMKMLFAFALIGPALAQSDSLTDYQRGSWTAWAWDGRWPKSMIRHFREDQRSLIWPSRYTTPG